MADTPVGTHSAAAAAAAAADNWRPLAERRQFPPSRASAIIEAPSGGGHTRPDNFSRGEILCPVENLKSLALADVKF